MSVVLLSKGAADIFRRAFQGRSTAKDVAVMRCAVGGLADAAEAERLAERCRHEQERRRLVKHIRSALSRGEHPKKPRDTAWDYPEFGRLVAEVQQDQEHEVRELSRYVASREFADQLRPIVRNFAKGAL